MFSNKTIVKLVSTGGLILFASLAAAQTYTSVPVKYEDGWWLEFKDDSRLSFKKTQGKLALQWKGVKHPWLSIKSQSVRADNFAALKTTTFDSYSKKKYAPILKSWQKRKAKHDKNEKKRYAKDQSEYEEFTCDLYFGKDHELKCIVPRKRIEVRDGEVNKGKTENNILVNFIQKKLQYIKGAQGCLTAQFFKHMTTDRILGIEINPRFGGGYPLSYYAGANYPKWIIQEYLLNQSIIPNDDWENNLLMLRYDKEVFVKNSDA